ncbi:MAG TPA: dipeptidyl carboxypeptidase II, partial [Sphingobacteriaceae bacterium]|nr:dipeptidyl carboxypeptidase II [Sphingobacteriaceae bacterium]
MNKISILSLLASSVMIISCNSNENSTGNNKIAADNPFLKESTLFLQAPAFDKIKNSDFQPAFEEGIKRQQDEVKEIAENTAAPTFENTVVALEKSGQMLGRVNHAFNVLSSTNSNPDLQKLKEEIAPKLTASNDAIYLNTKLFKRIDTIYGQRAALKLDPESEKLLEVYYQQFELAGAKLSEEDKIKLKKLNEEEASLTAKFTNQLQKDGKDLQNTTQQPKLQDMPDRAARQKLFEASINRAEKGDANDTRKGIQRIAQLRAQKAQLIGFKNYATLKLQDQMAKTPEAVEAFLGKLVPAATAKAKGEAKEIQDLIDKQKGGFKLEPWDWNFYSEQVRKAKFNIDESQIKPYFELNKVLQNGVFYAANQLYGLTFKERHDLPVWQEDVKVFDVMDKDGSQLALFYCDYFKRDNKDGGAWMDNIVPQSRLLGTKPVIYNSCNFAKPKAGEPALLSFDDVTTMFHEFGHALHGMFASQNYPSISGTSVARDFVEFPSQFNEHWATDPKVLKNYAVHYKTGAVIPQELLDKIKRSGTFNEGYAFTELLAASELDMQWHMLSATDPLQDVDKFEAAALAKTKVNRPEV